MPGAYFHRYIFDIHETILKTLCFYKELTLKQTNLYIYIQNVNF
jgi:hypothetical protein